MRALYQEFFEKSPLLLFPLLGLVLFMAFFAVVVIRVGGRRGRALQQFAALPLARETRSISDEETAS